MSKKNLFTMIFLILIVTLLIWILPGDTLFQAVGKMLNEKITIVVDPGHGGIDGGAESRGGVCEKDINLSIAQKIRQLAEDKEWKVVMTRTADNGLYSEGKNSVRSKKTQDLKKRQEIINNSGADASVSIHLNSYPSQSVKGAQVFYSKSSEEGKVIAEMIQEKIGRELDAENTRVALPKDDILIMKNNSAPLVLVECGFLSNDTEAEKLQDDSYQDKIAEIIVSTFEDYFVNTGKLEKEKIPVISSKSRGK